MDPLLLNGRGRVQVNRNGFGGGELSFHLGPPNYSLELTAGFGRTILDEFDLSLQGGVGSAGALSASIRVEEGAWSSRVRLQTRLNTIDWSSTWRFDRSGLVDQEISVSGLDLPQVSGTYGSSFLITADGLVREHLVLNGAFADIPLDVSLALSGIRFDALALDWTAHEAPFRLNSQVRIDASGFRRASVGLAIHTAWFDGRIELTFNSRGMDTAELRIRLPVGPVTITSTTRLTEKGVEETELEAMARSQF